MKNKNKYLILSMFVLAFAMFSFVSSQPDNLPFEQSKATGQIQYFIEFPKLDKAYVNTEFYFYSHVNYGNGTHLLGINETFITDHNLSCHLEGYAFNGEELFSQELEFVYDEFFILIPNSTFNNEADGYYTVYCEDKYGIVGLNSNPFIIKNERIVDDKNLSLNFDKVENIIILLVFILTTGLLIYLQKFQFAGMLWFFLGTILIISGMNIILSLIVFIVGISLAFSKK